MLETLIIELLNWLNEMPEVSDGEEMERREFLAPAHAHYMSADADKLDKTEWEKSYDVARTTIVCTRVPLDMRIFNQMELHLFPLTPNMSF